MRHRAVPVAGSIAAVAAATGLIYALRPIAPVLSLGVLYVPAVMVAAIVWGAAYAVPVAVVSMLAYNFFFLPPLLTLRLADGRNWTALGVYVATAVVVSNLATRAKGRALEAEQRGRETALLSDAAAELLLVRDAEELLDDLRQRSDRVLAGADTVGRERFEAALEALVETARERGRLEEAARESEAFRRSDRLKTAILQALSHDFRTPLATMTAAVGGLESDDLNLSAADRAELLETIRLEVDRLVRLVTNLLDLSRLQAEAARPHPELWAVDDLVTQSLDEVGERGRVGVELPDDLPAVRVDAFQIQRALVNLLENALKFSGQGTVDVRAAAAAGVVAIDVLDRGAGLGDDDAAGLFEPFARGSGSVSAGGAGLGLAIARGFAAVNGGGVELVAREGGGTIARLTLPAEAIPARAGS